MPENTQLSQERSCLLPQNSLMSAEIQWLLKIKNHLNPIFGTLQSLHYRTRLTSGDQNQLSCMDLDSVHGREDASGNIIGNAIDTDYLLAHDPYQNELQHGTDIYATINRNHDRWSK